MWPTVPLRLGGTAEGDRTQVLNGFFPSACTEEGGWDHIINTVTNMWQRCMLMLDKGKCHQIGWTEGK